MEVLENTENDLQIDHRIIDCCVIALTHKVQNLRTCYTTKPVNTGMFMNFPWVTAVERKQEGPTWVPTANTRREYAKEGKTLPAMVPPGPDNPMGLYAIYIGRLYAIHGTNANFGIGLRVSQGCIRLRNDDIKFLFDNVPVGTRVQLIDQPVKYSVEPDGSHWLEVHEPLSRNRAEFESDRKVPLPMTSALREFTQGPGVSPSQAEQTLQRRSGMPVNISATAAQGSL